MNSFVIAAASSGAGKTTLSLGLMRALTRRGLTVAPFKCGPDYIDTQFHARAAGRESVNLDIFMSSPEHVAALFARYHEPSGVNIVEGAMGLFDGYDGPAGSAAEVAATLDVPVVLLVNAASAAYTVAATILGCRTLRPGLRIAGVVMNRVGSERHERMLRRAAEDAGVRWLGHLPKLPDLATPSRHLGLTLTARDEMEQFINAAAAAVEATVDIPALLDATSTPDRPQILPPHNQLFAGRRIGVARDDAFNFIYRANLDALTDSGASLHFFSPIADPALPPDLDALYLPGGYPELYAEALEANGDMRLAVREFAKNGGHILAECGGMLYLGHDIDGRAMTGVLPLRATMDGARLHLGYRNVLIDNELLRGHEFHYSSTRELASITHVGSQTDASGRAVTTPIYRLRGVTASYTHLYWASNPASIAPML